MTAPEIQAALSAPFPIDDLQFRPGATSGNRALALCYVDARSVQDRLDAVLGIDGWRDDYQVLPSGSVVCKLSARIGGEWLSKTDVGSPSEQPDCGDQLKAAFSDALKRAAVKFGIGRYLYSLPGQWVDYDPKKKQLVSRPSLPAWAVPPKEQPKALPAPNVNGSAQTGAKITEAQRQELQAALDALGDGRSKVLAEIGKLFKVKRLGELPACYFRNALDLARRVPAA